MQHIFTVDVEEWFDGIVPGSAAHLERRLHIGMEKLLLLLRARNSHATFFWLGTCASAYPDLVRECADAGHEIGSHGLTHVHVNRMTPTLFRSQMQRATAELSDLIGAPIVSFRAPYFSIDSRSMWAFDILAELGYRFDSSRIPVRYWNYGDMNTPSRIHSIFTSTTPITEAPVATWRPLGFPMAATGGAYFRLYPYRLTRRNMVEHVRMSNEPSVFYFHPWELDAEQPRVNVPWRVRAPHYHRLESTAWKLERLLSDFSFAPLSSVAACFPDPARDEHPVLSPELI